MSEIKLKPCPFCGTMPYTSINESDGKKIKGYIQCNNPNCGVLMNFEIDTKGGFLKFDDVIDGLNEMEETWNRRADNETD